MATARAEFLEAAADEVVAAVAWYAARSETAARALQREIERAITVIEDAPRAWPRHILGTRRYLLRTFPFAIHYRVASQRIEIVAFSHGRRRPGYWRGR